MPNEEENKGKLLEYAYELVNHIRTQGLAIQNKDFEAATKFAEEIKHINKKIEAEKCAVHQSIKIAEEYVNILKECERKNAENLKNLEKSMNSVLHEMQELDKHKKVFMNYRPGEASRACIVDKNV